MVKQCNHSYKTNIYMINTTLGSVVVSFEHTFKSFLVMLTASFGKNSGVNFCTKMSNICCWRCIRPHDPFPIINTPVKISQSKLETILPLTWSEESFGGRTLT